MNEEQLLRKMFNDIGLGWLTEEATPNTNFSPYYDEKGKRYSMRQVKQHEIVYDKDGGQLANPLRADIVDMPILPTPVGNVVQGVSTSVAQENPALGLALGLLEGRMGMSKRTPKLKGSNYDNAYTNPYNNYGSRSPSNYVDDAIGGYNNKKTVYEMPIYGADGNVVKKVEVKAQNKSIITTSQANELQDQTRTATNVKHAIPTVSEQGRVKAKYPTTIQNELNEIYGDDAVNFLHEGATHPPRIKDYPEGMGMGYMRGDENKIAQKGVFYGKTMPQLELDISGVEHADNFSTILNHGEGLELARKISMDNNNMPIARMITPGGVSHIPLSSDWYNSMFQGVGYKNAMDLMKKSNVDPAFMNFEMKRLGEQAWDWYKQLRPEQKNNMNLSDFMNSPWIRQIQRGNKYPIKDQKTGKIFMDWKDKNKHWLWQEKVNPEVQAMWDRLQTGVKGGAWDDIDFMNMPDLPPEILHYLQKEGGYLGNMRLTAKPSRIDNLLQGKIGKPVLDDAGNPIPGKVLEPPFTRQLLDIVGDQSQISPFAMDRIMGKQGLIDAVSQMRHVQNLQDPYRPSLARGFGESNWTDWLLGNMTNVDQKIARNAWKLGVVPPMLMDDDKQNAPK